MTDLARLSHAVGPVSLNPVREAGRAGLGPAVLERHHPSFGQRWTACAGGADPRAPRTLRGVPGPIPMRPTR